MYKISGFLSKELGERGNSAFSVNISNYPDLSQGHYVKDWRGNAWIDQICLLKAIWLFPKIHA